MTDPLDGMTQEKWNAMTPAQRDAARDLSGLSPQLTPWKGWRVNVIRMDRTIDRFIVGQSTGWRPCHLEIKTSRSSGGISADKEYLRVTPIKKVR